MIETIVWISVLVIVFQALATTLLYFYRTNRYGIEQANAVTSGQRGLEQIVKTIREGAYSSDGAFPIVSIAANDFVFYADVDSDVQIERVHYYLSGTNLVQGILDPTGDPPAYSGTETVSTVAQYVRNVSATTSIFRYFDEVGTEITNYADWSSVRFVKSSLIINVDTNTLPNQLTMSSSAAIRNLVGR
jgi:hypothetical protein